MGRHVAGAGNHLDYRHASAGGGHQRGGEGHATALRGGAVDLAQAQPGFLGQGFLAELVVVGQGFVLRRIEIGHGAVEEPAVVVLDADTVG
ncbi:hypothetical protein D3C79_1031130 [compost metagenome]